MINKANDGNEPSILKFKTVEKCFFGLSGFGIKPPGLNPFVKAYIYNNYCLPKCTYGMGIFALNKSTINKINVSQNNLFRYCLGIPYKSHISNIMKALKILDAETLYYSQICTLIKLLHRHQYSKSLILKCLDNNSSFQLDIFDDIRLLSLKLNIDINYIIYYPDKTREMLLNNYLYNNVDQDRIDNFAMLLDNYSIDNKRKLIELARLNFVSNNVNIN